MTPALFSGVTLGLAGLAFLAAALHIRRRDRAARSWPKVPGQVLASWIQPLASSFSVEVRYEYDVSGQTFEGSRLGLGASSASTRDELGPILERYPAGGAVDVHCNPCDPADAVLDPGSTRRAAVYALAGAALAAAGVLTAVLIR